MDQHLSPDGIEFFTLIETYLGSQDRRRVKNAFELARQEHGKQRRKSGELFFTHPLTVAFYLAEYRLDADTLAAALLHDVAEDTRLSIEEIADQFGAEVGRLVDGVTKLKEVTAGAKKAGANTPEALRDATLQKLFEGMTTDIRVVIIKLFDRLHNMRTIKALPQAKQKQKAEETLAVYAPLANRLGIWRLKNELEALSLETLESRDYHILKQRMDRLFLEQQPAYAMIAEQIIECLVQHNVKVVNVLPCPESVSSVYQTTKDTASSFNRVDTRLRVVVLLEDIPSCYLAMGYIHELWRPVPGTFDDYIALPRDNLYRALHTTVIHTTGQPVKVRLRSVAMNEVSEVGVLARWVYAGTPLWSQGIKERVRALFDNILENIRLEPLDPSAAVKGVVDDVFRKQIMVYTPRGDVIELPMGATPVDFAYHIHTEVGNQCQGAYVNDQRYPLNKPLRDGDQVQIVKSGWAKPQRVWLDENLGYLATSRARSHARRWFRRLSHDAAISQGRALLNEELAMLGLPDHDHAAVAKLLDYEAPSALYYALGRAEILPTAVATCISAAYWHNEPTRNVGSKVRAEDGAEYIITNAANRKVRLCRSCNARPGSEIVGFIRADKGVTVHREGCHTLRPDPLAGRAIKLGWARQGNYEVRTVTIQIDLHDRTGLLFEIADLMRHEEINISAINTSRRDNDELQLVLDLEIANPRQLVRILHQVHALVNVYAVRCLLPEQPAPSSAYYLPE